MGMHVTSVSIYIQRKKNPSPQPKTRIGKFIQAIEPVIVVGPFYNCANVHSLNFGFMVGESIFASPEDSLLLLPLRKELDQLMGLLKGKIPELNCRV